MLGLDLVHARVLAGADVAVLPVVAPVIDHRRDAAEHRHRVGAARGGERGGELFALRHVPRDREPAARTAAHVGRGAESEPRTRARDCERAEAERERPHALARIARQLGEQRLHRRKPLRRIRREPARDHATQPRRHVGIARHRFQLARDHVRAELGERVPGERTLAIQRLVQRDAERKLIGGRPDDAAAKLLRRHVCRRSHHRAGASQIARQRSRLVHRPFDRDDGRRLLLAGQPDEPEVGDSSLPVLEHEDVVGLEVAMYEPGFVCCREPAAGMRERRRDFPLRAAALEPMPQRATARKLHRDVHLLAARAGLVDAQHVRVIDARHRLRLAQQARARVLGSGRYAEEQLDGDLAIEVRIVRGVDHAHTAGAQDLEHDETTDRLATCEGGSPGQARLRVARARDRVCERRSGAQSRERNVATLGHLTV